MSGADSVDRAVLDRFARIGVAGYDCPAAEVRVQRAWWSAIDVEGKKTLIERVERVCATEGGAREFDVRDSTSGDPLTVGRVSWIDTFDR